MTDTKRNIIDNAVWYQSNPRPRWKGEGSDWDSWHVEAHQHFTKKLYPRIKAADEHFVEYWPARFKWGVRKEQRTGVTNGRMYVHTYGTFATGYFTITDKSCYIVGLKKPTADYPIIHNTQSQGLVDGFVGGFLKSLAGESDDQEPIRQDMMIHIPLSSIYSAELRADEYQTKAIFIKTGTEVYQVYRWFTGTEDEMVSAIRMGRSGQLAAIWQKPKTEGADIQRLQNLVQDLKSAPDYEFRQDLQSVVHNLQLVIDSSLNVSTGDISAQQVVIGKDNVVKTINNYGISDEAIAILKQILRVLSPND